MALRALPRPRWTIENAKVELQKATGFKGEELDRLWRQIVNVGRKSPVGVPGTADAAIGFGKAGWAPKDLIDAATLAGKASVAFDMPPEAAGQALKELANQLGAKKVGPLAHLADIVNMLGDTTAADEADILRVLGRSTGQAKYANVKPEAVAALAASMLELGVAPEVAGTGLNALFGRLMAPESQSKSFREGLATIGLTPDALGASVRQDGIKALVDLLSRIDRQPAETKGGALVDIFGNEYADDMARLMGNLNALNTYLTKVQDPSTFQGGVDQTWDLRNSTTSSSSIGSARRSARPPTNSGRTSPRR